MVFIAEVVRMRTHDELSAVVASAVTVTIMFQLHHCGGGCGSHIVPQQFLAFHTGRPHVLAEGRIHAMIHLKPILSLDKKKKE